jgi:hypothetical protein
MTKNKDTKQPYSEWLHNRETINHLKTQIEKVGYPLEFAVKKIFHKCNYEISNAYYLHPGEKGSTDIWREIDIFSCKKMTGFDIKGCKVSFRLFVIGDCKYSSMIDLFGFESETGRLGSSFPILYNAETFFGSGAKQFFKFPLISQNISEINVSDRNFHSNEMNIYPGCYQILNAFAYFVSEYRRGVMKDNYVNIYRRIKLRTWFKEHKEYAKQRQINDEYSLPSESEIEKNKKRYFRALALRTSK